MVASEEKRATSTREPVRMRARAVEERLWAEENSSTRALSESACRPSLETIIVCPANARDMASVKPMLPTWMMPIFMAI